MKKLSLVLIGLLLTAAVVTAQANFTVNGSFYTSIGADLDNGTTGLDIGVTDLGFQAVAGEAKSVEKVSDADVYGEVMIKGLTIESETQYVDGGNYSSVAMKFTWDTIASRLVFGDNFSIGFWHTFEDYTSFSLKGFTGGNLGFIQNAYDYYLFNGLYGASNATGAAYNSWDTTNGSPNNRTFFVPHSWSATQAKYNDKLSLDLTIPQAIDVNVFVGSWKAWNDPTRFDGNGDGSEITAGDNAYTFSTMVSLTAVENLTLRAIANFDLGVPWRQVDASKAAQPLSFGAMAGYKIVLSDDISIFPQVAFDGQLPEYDSTSDVTPIVYSGDGFDFGLSGGVTVALKNTKIALNVGYSQDNAVDMPDTAGDDSSSVSTLAFTGSVSFGLIEGLSVKGAFEYSDPVAAMTAAGAEVTGYTTGVAPAIVNHSYAEDATIGVAAELSYDIKATEKGVITPFVKFSTDNKNGNSDVVGVADDYAMYFKGGVTLKGFVDNTSFNLEWDSNDLSDTENTTATESLGQIVFTTRITI